MTTASRSLPTALAEVLVVTLLVAGALALALVSGCDSGAGGGNGGANGGGGASGNGNPMGYLPAVVGAVGRALEIEAMSDLRTMMQYYVNMMSNQPKSTGYRFWLALFTGDMPNLPGAMPPSAAPCNTTSDISLLICPGDTLNVESETHQAIVGARASPGGQSMLDSRHCSWAGPSEAVVRGSPGRNAGLVFGTSGGRDGVSFFRDGYVQVTGNLSATFEKYDDGDTLPSWGEGQLESVLPYPGDD